MDKKIVLICIEENTSKVAKELSPPFGLLVAASVLRSAGRYVEIYHIVDGPDLERNLADMCSNAFIVGFTTMTTSNLKAVVKASRIVSGLGIFVYWGGAHATLLPEISLNEPSVNAVLRGEAEANLLGLVKWREGKVDPESVPGLCFKREDGSLCIQDLPKIVHESELSCHAFDLLDMSVYLGREEYHFGDCSSGLTRVLPYMTSKGCHKNCAFCYNSVVNRGKWRGYGLDNVFREMDWLRDTLNLEGWYFYDDNFFTDQDRAWAVLERYSMPSFVELDLHRVDASFLERARACNVERLYIGAESGNDVMLRRIRKGITADEIRFVADLCSKYNVDVEFSFMMLFPGETPEQLRDTFNLVSDLRTYKNVRIDGPKVYNPYPGTSLYRELLESGWKAPQTNEEWSAYVRDISPRDTGVFLTEKHFKVLSDNGIVF